MGYTVQYYDLVLVGIIGALAIGALVGAMTVVRMPVAIISLGAVSVAVMGHALFVNGPVDEVDDLTNKVDEGPINPEYVPLLE